MLKDKGFYQPLVFVIVFSIIVGFFGLLHLLYLDKAVLGMASLQDVQDRVENKLLTNLDLFKASGDAVNADYNTIIGLTVENIGEKPAYLVSIYWVSPTNSFLCLVDNSDGASVTTEIRREGSETLDTTVCPTQTTASGDYFVINSTVETKQRFI